MEEEKDFFFFFYLIYEKRCLGSVEKEEEIPYYSMIHNASLIYLFIIIILV